MLKTNDFFYDEQVPPLFNSIRFLTSIIIFFGYCFQNMLRINLSIGIVCMVNHTAINLDIKKSKEIKYNITYNMTRPKCAETILNDGEDIDGPYNWPRSTQGLILSSYFYGHIITQLFGGWLSYKFGSKRIIIVSMGISSLLTTLVPISAQTSYIALIVNRVLIGGLHGVFWPSVSSIWAYWAPPNERGTLTGVANAGTWFGSLIALPLGGHLCINDMLGGWESMFYIHGMITFSWCILFASAISDKPENHKFISVKERDYIIRETSKISHPSNQRTPWLGLLTSRACIAIFIAHFCSNWSISLFLNKYIKDLLRFDIESNGLVSAIPNAASCFLNIISSIVSDKLIQSRKIKRTCVRKLFGCIGFFIPVAALSGLLFVTCEHPTIGIFLLVIVISFNAVCHGAGHIVNINDVSGPFSGILFGISNTIATLPGIICPVIVGILTVHQYREEWQLVLVICIGFYLVGGIVYLLIGDANLQPWALNLEKRRESIY